MSGVDRRDTKTPRGVRWADRPPEGITSVDAFLVEVARLSSSDAPGAMGGDVAPDLVVGSRYRLVRFLGRGAHGVVWLAIDELSGARVALKILVATSSERVARVRAEIATLRRLRVPGVAHLLDEGTIGESVFVAMPFIDGLPFPGRRFGSHWRYVARAARTLLETLASVHRAGVVHRDLKPANVLVDKNGDSTVLDFGLALAPRFEQALGHGVIVGTPAFLAPEHGAGVDPADLDPRSDLYAVGAMLYLALSGRLPHQATNVARLLAAKQKQPRPLSSVVARQRVPAQVARVVDRLLAPRRDDRPASALEALDGLMSRSSVHGSAPRRRSDPVPSDRVLSIDDLLSLMEGADRIGWIRGDLARLLHHKTGGVPALVLDVLEQWIRRGVCRWTTDTSPRLVLDDDAAGLLEKLEWAHVDDVEAALARASFLARTGQLARAAGILEAISDFDFDSQRSPWPSNVVDRVFSAWVEVAMGLAIPRALDHVLYALSRRPVRSALTERLVALVHAALAVGAWTDRALVLASQVPLFEDPSLERLRQEVRVLAARRTSLATEEALLAELAPWGRADAPAESRAALSMWRGRLCYRQGRFAEAARHHGDAAALSTWATRRAYALTSRASALMEAFDLDAALATAHGGVRAALETRHVYGRALAEWTLRTIRYRSGAPIEPDTSFVDAVGGLDVPDLEALASLTEATIAWRAARLDVAHALALRARALWASIGERGGGGLLASSLAIASKPARASRTEEAGRLMGEAIDCAAAGVGIQALALLAGAGVKIQATTDAISKLARQVPADKWHVRIDVLSIDECLDRLALTLHGKRIAPA